MVRFHDIVGFLISTIRFDIVQMIYTVISSSRSVSNKNATQLMSFMRKRFYLLYFKREAYTDCLTEILHKSLHSKSFKSDSEHTRAHTRNSAHTQALNVNASRRMMCVGQLNARTAASEQRCINTRRHLHDSRVKNRPSSRYRGRSADSSGWKKKTTRVQRSVSQFHWHVTPLLLMSAVVSE